MWLGGLQKSAFGEPGADRKRKFMRPGLRRKAMAISIFSFLICCGTLLMRSNAAPGREQGVTSKLQARTVNSSDAYRFNTLGVAYMNQQKPADAQNYFTQALGADPKFAVARVNLGISLMGQQKLEPARAALEEAAKELPKDPYAWYNLGLVYKDLGETEKGIAAFQRVTELTNEADAYYFLGYLNTQLQKYDEATMGIKGDIRWRNCRAVW